MGVVYSQVTRQHYSWTSSTLIILLMLMRGCLMFVAYPYPQSFSQFGIEASL